jgi:Uma2 family endonuclease
MALAQPRTRRFTTQEYERLADDGFFKGQRVELIFGEIIKMPAMKNFHAIAMGLGEDALRSAFGPKFWVRPQLPLVLGKFGEPEPDLAVVAGNPRDYTEHPRSALLVMEISDTSLKFDRGRKAAQYAYAGIEDYWIINLLDGQVEVHREPKPNARRPRKSTFASQQTFGPDEKISPLVLPKKSLLVADLLP